LNRIVEKKEKIRKRYEEQPNQERNQLSLSTNKLFIEGDL
jgi:hypothetical protein